MIAKTIQGDLVKMALEGDFDVIVHGCNCHNTMGAGIAKQIKYAFPEAYYQDCQTERGDRTKLGNYSCATDVPVGDGDVGTVDIINAYTQYDYRGKSPVDYKAIKMVFELLNKDCGAGERIGIPKIGAGLAGGDWATIKKIIDAATPNLNITLVEYKA